MIPLVGVFTMGAATAEHMQSAATIAIGRLQGSDEPVSGVGEADDAMHAPGLIFGGIMGGAPDNDKKDAILLVATQRVGRRYRPLPVQSRETLCF
jgi:hypothetical protein